MKKPQKLISKIGGLMLIFVGTITFFFALIFWATEDYTRQSAPMWPIWLGMGLILGGIITLKELH